MPNSREILAGGSWPALISWMLLAGSTPAAPPELIATQAPPVSAGPIHVGPFTSSAPASESRPAASQPGSKRLSGVIAASQTRPMKPADDAGQRVLLKQYEEPAGEVAWAMDRLMTTPSYDVYDLRFPSPVVTPTPENNTVYCEYYRCRGDQKRPAVIVLHILDGKFRESRLICSYLALRGMDGLLLKMAYYGPRRPKDPQQLKTFAQDLETMRDAVRQSAMDARRAARWLGAQPHVDPARISILGTSLGGFVGSVASGVDGRFHRSVFVLAGGRLEQVLTSPSREVRSAREAIASSGTSSEELVQKLIAVEPCSFAKRIAPRSVLMINAKSDPVVPPTSAQALAAAIGGVAIQWYEGDHYALIWKLPEVLARVADHLARENPSSWASP